LHLFFKLNSVSDDKTNIEDKLKATEAKLELVTAKVNEVTTKYDATSVELKQLSEKSAFQIKTGKVGFLPFIQHNSLAKRFEIE